MVANFGLVEDSDLSGELDAPLKLAEDMFSLASDASKERSSISNTVELDNPTSFQESKGSTLSPISASEESLPSSRVVRNKFDNLDGVLSSRLGAANAWTIQQPSNGFESRSASEATSLQNQSAVSSITENSQSGFKLNADSGWLGGGTSDFAAQPAQFVCDCEECCGSSTPQFEHLVSGASDQDSGDVNLNVPKTGDLRIDALLHGHKWTTPTITYSFFDDQTGGPYYSSKYKGIGEVSDTIKSYLRHILEDVIEPLINVDFVEVNDTKNSYGQIRYMYTTSTSSASTTRLSSSSDIAGDVRFNPKIRKDIEEGPGAYRYETLVHETLHALGLKHPGNYNGSSNGGQDGPFLPNGDDNSANSVMSYNRLKELNPTTGAIAPMSYDILALQYLYGAKEKEAGDTAYKFQSVYGYTIGNQFYGDKNRAIKQTVWDSGGKDTFDFSGLTSNQSGYYLDLTEGGWITTQSAYNSTSYKARGDGKTYTTTAFGTSLAYNMTIENVINSSSSDYIVLNPGSNTISGYQRGKRVGNDSIVNANSKDTLDLSSYKSSEITQTASGNDLVINLGSDGSITLKDYQTTSQNQRIKILLDGSTPPIDPPVDPPPGNTVRVSFQQGVSNYAGTVDTYINSGSAKKHGAATLLRVDGESKTGHIDQALIRFEDLFGQGAGKIAPNAQIKSAYLELDAINGGDSLALHRMLTNWSGTDTWGSLGNGIQANGVEAATNAEAITGVVGVGLQKFDVTASLKAWQATPNNNYGWAILPTGTDGVNFSSAEGITAPRLVVEYATDSTPVDPPVDPPVPPPTSTPVEVSFQQGVNGYRGAADTYLHTNDNTNYAASTILRTDGQTSSNRVEEVLLRFNDIIGNGSGQIDPNAQIKSASLQLAVTNKGDSLKLHRMLTNWSDTDTWGSLGNGIQTNDREAVSQADVVTGPISAGLQSFDVTASLQAWLANPGSNYGWAIVPTGTDGVYFDSSEGSTAPRLVVEYAPSSPPVPPPTSTPVEVSFQQGVNGYRGAADTYLHTNDNTNYAASTILRTDGQTSSHRVEEVLLRFDDIIGNGSGQIDPNAQIESASLQLAITNKGDSLELHRMLTNWSDTDTWGSLGNGIQTNDREAASQADVVTGPVGTGLQSFDVTASLQAWLANPGSNYGWAIVPTGTDGVYFDSSEGTTAPRLVVKYSTPSQPPTPAPVGKTIIGTASSEQLQGGAGNDLIKGGHGDDGITGWAGDDTIYGGEGIDTIAGGSGNDRISGGQRGDQLSGGAGVDVFTYRYIGHGGDTISDFDVRSDRFDVSDIFTSTKYGSANVFNDYIQVVGSTEGAKVRLDLQGDAGDQFKTLATLQGVDDNSLNANHFIV